MPLVRRPLPNWQAYQEATLPRNASGGPRSDLARSWPTELPPPDQAAAQSLLPRRSAQPGTTPVRGRPTPKKLGLEPGASPTGQPSMGQGRSSIFMAPTY